jgi:integrase
MPKRSSKVKVWPPIRYHAPRSSYVVDVGTKLSAKDPETGIRKRVREYFKTKAEAETYAEQCRAKLKNQGISGFKLSRLEQVDAEEALKILSGKASLVDASRYFMKFNNLPSPDLNIESLVDEFLKYKISATLSPNLKSNSARTIKDYQHRLGLLSKAFGVTLINRFSHQEFLDWIQVRGDVRGLTRTTKALFSYACDKGYIPENPIKGKIPSLKIEKPSILKDDQWRSLVVTALETQDHKISDRGEPINLLAWVVLGLWCGLRPEAELRRLEWSDVNIDEGFVNISDDWKVAIGRHVTIPECAKILLKKCVSKKGKVVSERNFRKRWEWLRKSAGIINDWDHDIMRHTYASMHYAYFGDKRLIESELGHCNSSMLRHYINHGAKMKKKSASFFEFGLKG